MHEARESIWIATTVESTVTTRRCCLLALCAAKTAPGQRTMHISINVNNAAEYVEGVAARRLDRVKLNQHVTECWSSMFIIFCGSFHPGDEVEQQPLCYISM